MFVECADQPISRRSFESRVFEHFAASAFVELPQFRLECCGESEHLESMSMDRVAFGGGYLRRRTIHLAVDRDECGFSRQKSEARKCLRLLRSQLEQSERFALAEPCDHFLQRRAL